MKIRQLACIATALSAAIVLAACDRQEPPRTAGEQVDRAVEKSKDALENAGQAASAAIDSAGTAIEDTAITAEVKARLAADEELKMLDIGVQTNAGRTVMMGTAPNAAARDRATRIAEAVGGVKDVDNQLLVPQ